MSVRTRLRGIVAARSLRGSIHVADDVRIGRGVRLDVARGGSLRIAGGCRLGDGCRLVVCSGAIDLGADCVVGEQCTLIAQREITVGAGSRLEDGVSILDFGPAPTDTERPTRGQPLHAAAVELGRDVVVGLRAAIGPGVRLPASARIEPGIVLGGVAEPLLRLLEPPPPSRPKVPTSDAGKEQRALSSSVAEAEPGTRREVGE
jgi:carbonic anhydrase/acetyltransferase-like protein (isoleucine patch superfamily)